MVNMSASPADRTPGGTPNGGPPRVMRRPKAANPMVPKVKKKPPQRAPMTNGHPVQQPNGLRAIAPGHMQSMPQHSGRPTPPISRPSAPLNSEMATSGFTSPPIAQFTDFPLVLTKRALMEGLRHHVARFSSKRNVDPRDEQEFVRPVRLHRRDPRAPPGGGGTKSEDQAMGGTDDVDDKEREKQDILKAERDAQREADRALVAPASSTTGTRKMGHNMKKTEQIWRNDQTEEQKAQSKLRYEEALPWHLEDFDNKSTWVGSYEAALSDTYAMMVLGQDGVFRITPLEKWYKFTQKNQFKTLTIEEAEKRFSKKVKEPRWFMDSEESKQKKQSELQNKKASSGLFLGKWEKGGGGSGIAAPTTKNENADADDLDFQEDRFADDEENMLFEEDEETKEAEERIKRDQLQANVFDLKEEKEYEKQELLEKKEKEAEKKLGKGVKKALKKREKNYIYDSDSTDNPYSSESESDDTETERLKEEERKKAEEIKSSPEKDKLKTKQSRASSKGTNTPSHRPSKHADPLKHATSTNNLKRPGSPLDSEASGNESTHKKQKKKHPLSSAQVQTQTNNTLQPPSRPGSPPLPLSSAPIPTLSRKPSNVSAKRPRGGGSGSDTEGAAGSGGEMSDGTREKKRIKLKLGMPSKNGTPQGSRSGSPEIPNANAVKAGGSHAGSPGISLSSLSASLPQTSLASKGAAPFQLSLPFRPLQQYPGTGTSANKLTPVSPQLADAMPLPTAAEIRNVVPPEGITVSQLLAHFKGRNISEDAARKTKFMKLMKENTQFERVRRVLLPLAEKP